MSQKYGKKRLLAQRVLPTRMEKIKHENKLTVTRDRIFGKKLTRRIVYAILLHSCVRAFLIYYFLSVLLCRVGCTITSTRMIYYFYYYCVIIYCHFYFLHFYIIFFIQRRCKILIFRVYFGL